MASVFREGKRPHFNFGVAFFSLKGDRRFWHRVGPDRLTGQALADRIEQRLRLP